jgi:hypothetical protein
VDDRIWRNISIGLGVVCALLIGVAGALMIVGNRGESSAGPSTAPTQVAAATATGSPAIAPSIIAVATPAYSGPPTPTPVPSQSAPFATVVFNGMTLDAANDRQGTARTFTFQTDGIGYLNLSVIKTSAGGATRMCAKVDTQAFACKIGSLPNFTKAYADTAHSTWTVTLVGYGNSKPTVDLSLTWPSAGPKVTLSHGRLQGSSSKGVSEGLNGFTATFKPRAAGSLDLQASWTLATVNADVSLTDVTSLPAIKVDDRQYTSATYVNPPYTFNVDSTKTYQLKLRDLSPDSQRPDLTAEISFP